MNQRQRLHPTQLVAIAFTLVILVGTVFLMLPVASLSGKATNFLDALFTSTSAVTVTGLLTLDIQSYWSEFGHWVIAVLMEIGGFGIIGFATLVGFLLEGRISIRNKMLTTSEAQLAVAPDIKSMLKNIAKVMVFFQLVLFVILFIRFHFFYGYDFSKALGHGAFHSISTFNNAGFSLYSDSLIRFVSDPWIIAPIVITVSIASLGFPVIVEIRDRLKVKLAPVFKKPVINPFPRQWSLNTRIVLWATLWLMVIGTLFLAILEWNNPKTIGGLDTGSKLLNISLASIMPRTAGYNAIDISQANPSSWLIMDILMFIGGGSASTAGGIKIGTVVVLFYIVYAEIRGEGAVNIGNRRLPRSMQRQALTIVSVAAAVMVAATTLLRLTTNFTLDEIIFEVTSAIGTTGLSIGITPLLPDHAKLVFSLLMLFGRLGPIVVATSLALRHTKRHFEYPRERPLIG